MLRTANQTNNLRLLLSVGFGIIGLLLVVAGVFMAILLPPMKWSLVCIVSGGVLLFIANRAPGWVDQSIDRSYRNCRKLKGRKDLAFPEARQRPPVASPSAAAPAPVVSAPEIQAQAEKSPGAFAPASSSLTETSVVAPATEIQSQAEVNSVDYTPSSPDPSV